ncbi:MAG: metallophosphoesterase family protein [Verrucomicrobiota bacterium]
MPLTALISDIHGNIDALEAVLADIESRDISHIFCLGDVVGYGGAPGACVRLIRIKCPLVLMGNHEAFTFSPINPQHFSEDVAIGIEKAREESTEEDLEWMKGLPLVGELDGAELVHASLDSPESFRHLLHKRDAIRHLEHQASPICFVGHTHLPGVFAVSEGSIRGLKPENEPIPLDPNFRFVVNVGSVGQPRDRNPKACYAIYDSDESTIEFCRVKYDVAAAIARFKEAGMHASSWKRLKKGV